MGIFGDNDKREHHILEEILEELKKIARILLRPLSVTLQFTDLQGEKLTMPLTLTSAGAQAQAQLNEWSGPGGTGSSVAPIGPVSYTSSDPTVATVDPASGVCTAVANGAVSITGSDAGNSLTASDTLTVAIVVPPPVAVSATLSLTAITPVVAAALQAAHASK